MSSWTRVFLVGIVGFLLLVAPAFGQSQATTGVIEGVVTDDSDAVLPGVLISLRNTATNFEQTTVTGATGRFRGVLLPLGPYTVTASLSGFTTLVREGITLSVGRRVNLNMQLSISTVEESIVVTGEAPLIETTRTEGSTLLDQRSLSGLPEDGRNFLRLTLLTPGTAIVQGPDGDELSISGQRGIQNNIMVDGADFNNPFFGEQRGGQRPQFTFNLDAVKEFVVITDGANAEFGRSSSGFVNVVTKSGTNEVHGTAHFFGKHDALSAAAKLPDGSEEPEFSANQQQYGFTLGGPIKKDKAFYFVAFDGQRNRSTRQTNPDRIEQRVVDAFAALGSPDENGSIDRTNDAAVLLTKIDWNLNENHLLTLRYNFTWSEQKNGTFDVNSWGRSANALEKDYSNAVSGSLISNISDSMFNEFRFQFAREDRPRPYDGPNVAGQDRPLPDTAFDFGRAYRFGMPFFIPVEYYDTRIQFNNNLSIIKGDHSFKLGVEFNRVESVQTFIGFANGRYIFGSTDGFLNYLSNPNYVECSDGSSSFSGVCSGGASPVGPVLLYLQQAGVGTNTVQEAGTQSIPQTEPSFFFQDEWRPNNKLTINYGIRWEAQIQPDLITPINDLFYAPFIGQTVNGQEFPGDGTIPSDWNMWQPRFGISYVPDDEGKTVIRANAGIYNARIPGLVTAQARSTDGSRGQSIFRSSEAAPFLGPVPAYPNILPQSEIGDTTIRDVYVFDKNFQNPDTYAFSASIERQFLEDFAFLVKYNLAKTEHLTRYTNRNDPLLGANWGTGLGADGNSGIGTLWTIESTAKSKYWGLTFGLNKNWTDNYQFQLNYTYSKDRSDDDNERDPFSLRYAKITDLDSEYGFSDRDQRHRFNMWWLSVLPGEINLNVRYQYQTAQPLPLTADGSIAAEPTDRINPDGSVTERNLGRKDNEFNALDFRLSRPFDVGGMVVEPIFEVFNLFNSNNFRRPAVTNLIFNFDGTVQSGAGDPREIQMGVRLSW